MSSQPIGLLDTNVVVRSRVNDPQTEECRRFLNAVAEGKVRIPIEPVVLHEITYVLTRQGPRLPVAEVTRFIETLLTRKGAEGELDSMRDANVLWKDDPSVGFVDCYLAAKARNLNARVYTKDDRHLRRLGAEAPDPLPGF